MLLPAIVGGALLPCAAAHAAERLPFSFKRTAYEMRELGFWARQFSRERPLPPRDAGVHDRYGVRMRRVRGRLYDFPRGQATYGLLNLSSYVASGDGFYLDRALAQARRLRNTRVAAGDAWYYPNRPSRSRHGVPGEVIAAPYYSALSQGRVLMFFSRLTEVTGDARWRDAADRTFLSFLRRGPRSGPYVARVDARGYYWLEEWPWPPMPPDRTFNGHNSSAYGLYEYWLLTRDGRALELLRGAATTTQRYAGAFRRPGWLSLYCLAHRQAQPFYHDLHSGQLLAFYRLTGAPGFARAADRFLDDYPRPRVKGRIRIAPGACVGIRFDGSGRVTARRAGRVRAATTARVVRRQRRRGAGIYFKVTTGHWAGYWLPEQPGRVYLPGVIVRQRYDPERRLALSGGRDYPTVRVDADGAVLQRGVLHAADDLVLRADQRAVVNGIVRARLSEGEFTGCWVRLCARARLR